MNLTFTYTDPVTHVVRQIFIHNIPAGRIYHKIDPVTGRPYVNQQGRRYQFWTTDPIHTGFQPNAGGNVVDDGQLENPSYTADMIVNGVNLNQIWSDNNDIWYAERF